MVAIGAADWTRLDRAARRAQVLRLGPRDVAALARTLSWSACPLDVLGAIAARPDCTLGSALTIFVRGEPERFERPDAALAIAADRGAFQLLLRLHATINGGAHRFDPRELPEEPLRLERLVVPRRDRPPGRPVWGFDPAVVGPALALAARPLGGAVAPDAGAPAGAPRRGRLRLALHRLAGGRRPA